MSFFYLGLGMLTFFVTGIDDIAVVFLLAQTGKELKGKNLAIILGTVLGAALMFIGVIIAVFFAAHYINIKYLRILGIAPIIIGIRGLSSIFVTEDEDESRPQLIPKNNVYSYFFAALLIYLSNSIDDLSANKGIVIDLYGNTAKEYLNILLLGVGNLIGAFALAYIGVWGGNKFKSKFHLLPILAPFILIGIGTVVILKIFL